MTQPVGFFYCLLILYHCRNTTIAIEHNRIHWLSVIIYLADITIIVLILYINLLNLCDLHWSFPMAMSHKGYDVKYWGPNLNLWPRLRKGAGLSIVIPPQTFVDSMIVEYYTGFTANSIWLHFVLVEDCFFMLFNSVLISRWRSIVIMNSSGCSIISSNKCTDQTIRTISNIFIQ